MAKQAPSESSSGAWGLSGSYGARTGGSATPSWLSVGSGSNALRLAPGLTATGAAGAADDEAAQLASLSHLLLDQARQQPASPLPAPRTDRSAGVRLALHPHAPVGGDQAALLGGVGVGGTHSAGAALGASARLAGHAGAATARPPAGSAPAPAAPAGAASPPLTAFASVVAAAMAAAQGNRSLQYASQPLSPSGLWGSGQGPQGGPVSLASPSAAAPASGGEPGVLPGPGAAHRAAAMAASTWLNRVAAKLSPERDSAAMGDDRAQRLASATAAAAAVAAVAARPDVWPTAAATGIAQAAAADAAAARGRARRSSWAVMTGMDPAASAPVASGQRQAGGEADERTRSYRRLGSTEPPADGPAVGAGEQGGGTPPLVSPARPAHAQPVRTASINARSLHPGHQLAQPPHLRAPMLSALGSHSARARRASMVAVEYGAGLEAALGSAGSTSRRGPAAWQAAAVAAVASLQSPGAELARRAEGPPGGGAGGGRPPPRRATTFSSSVAPSSGMSEDHDL